MDEAVHAGGVEDHGPEVGDDGPAALDLEPRRGVHPGVGDDNPDGGEDAAQRHHDGGEEVHLLADAVPAEDQHGQEAGLQEEGEDALGGQGAAEHVADVAGEGGPVGAELELHDDAGGDAHREVDGEDARPEPGHLVIDDVAGAQVRPLHDDHDRAEPDGQRREDVMEHDRQGELDAR